MIRRDRSGKYLAAAGSDTDALQTDVMRFMSILGLCLMAVFALVQSIPRQDTEGIRREPELEKLQHDIQLQQQRAQLLEAQLEHLTAQTLSAQERTAGARQAHYIFLRLPHELVQIVSDWLEEHFPDRRERVLSLVRQASGGRSYDSRFGVRQTGRGAYADMLASRFRTASRKLGLSSGSYAHPLDCSQFRRPGQRQLGLDL